MLSRLEDDKAKFFAIAGYNLDNWRRLVDDMRTALSANEAQETLRTPYGNISEVRMSLTGPNGRTIRVISVWICLYATGQTRLVTMYPDKGAR